MTTFFPDLYDSSQPLQKPMPMQSLFQFIGILIMLVGTSAFGTSVFSLLPIVCGDLMGQENVTSALGINFVYQAGSVFIGTFAAGKSFVRKRM